MFNRLPDRDKEDSLITPPFHHYRGKYHENFSERVSAKGLLPFLVPLIVPFALLCLGQHRASDVVIWFAATLSTALNLDTSGYQIVCGLTVLTGELTAAACFLFSMILANRAHFHLRESRLKRRGRSMTDMVLEMRAKGDLELFSESLLAQAHDRDSERYSRYIQHLAEELQSKNIGHARAAAYAAFKKSKSDICRKKGSPERSLATLRWLFPKDCTA